ncbi:hypothetical protein E8E13_005523 [Curvularia kusanoi]|uniref:Uncharacterized protein n=1 Tax=Curvularia kusanoi TaxID=90978 RepID=A0A9P4TG99_CURKU|nr:hypothetical protein E8E13_005523 [Curvularia kusanoi]
MEYHKVIQKKSPIVSAESQGKTNEFVQQSELPPESSLMVAAPSRRSFVEKLGVYNIFVLVFGSIAIFIAIAFFTLLWSGSETARNGQPTPVLWYRIAEKPNWATRVVTVGSVFIRLAAASQMGLLAALVAAWTLETTGASAEHLPLLSIIRTVNNGPQSHIWSVFHSMRTGTRRFYSTFIILAILDALALQFTSTLLVTDFDRVTLVSQGHNQSISYNFNSTNEDVPSLRSRVVEASSGLSPILAMPAAYPRFAEFANANTSRISADYIDTGESYRAFLPIIDSNTRGSLRSYRGPATVVDSRIRCARPSLSISNVSAIYQTNSDGGYNIIIVGTFTMNATIPGFAFNMTEEDGYLMTTAIARLDANTTDWRLSYSRVTVGDTGRPPTPIATYQYNDLIPWLLLNITGNWTNVLDDHDTTGVVGPFDWIESPSGPWTDLRTTNDTLDIGISATVCFTSFDENDLLIDAQSEQDFTEPKDIPWIKDAWEYDTEQIRKMLGAVVEPLSPSERGIFNLQQQTNWTNSIINATGDQPLIGQAIVPVHRKSSFAMFMIMSQTIYYGSLPLFFLDGMASVATSKTYVVPKRWTGYTIVMALLVVHAALVITALVLFLSKTDHSMLGQSWMAVAQVSSSDTMDTVHHASNMTDLEVKRLLRMNSFETNEVVLRTGADGGRSQAVYRKGTGESG